MDGLDFWFHCLVRETGWSRVERRELNSGGTMSYQSGKTNRITMEHNHWYFL